jgi:hypothetical protein
MNKYYFLSILFFSISIYSQKITGSITSEDSAIANASVVIKKNNKIIFFDFSDTNGNFSFTQEKLESISIEVFKTGFQKKTTSVLITKDTKVAIDLVAKEIALDEVIIQKPKAITEKQDTIVYNPKLFKDGTERVVEDLLKKLPGISVRDNGKIFFKNKEIQSLMLEGDDLFNSQYTIGSKNIPIDLVESIEAIENFNTNKVLQKITESDKVALNLKLKKDKTNLNLNADLQNDFYSKYNNVATAILLNEKIKAFSTLGLNNLGVNYESDFSFSGKDNLQFNTGRKKELLSLGNFPTFLGDNNSLLNNGKQLFTSFIKNLTKQTKANFGVSVYHDKINQDFINQSNYTINQDTISIFTREIQTKRPTTITLNNTTSYYNDDDLQIETKVLAQLNRSDLLNDINNNGNSLTSDLQTKSYYIGTKTELTKKLASNSAINGFLFLSNSKSNQVFQINPGFVNFDNPDSKSIQKSEIHSTSINSDVAFFKNYKFLKIKVSNNFEFQNDQLNSILTDTNNQQIQSDFINDNVYKILQNNLILNFNYKRNKFKISSTTQFLYNNLKFDKQDKQKTTVLIGMNFKYRLNKKNTITLDYKEDLNFPKLDNLFDGFILTSFRTLSSNQSILDYIKTKDGRLSYNFNDVYNTFTLSFGGGYSYSDKDYYQSNTFTNDVTYLNTALLNLGNDRIYFDFNVDKLVPFIKTTVKLNTTYSNFSSFNFINNSELRNVKNQAINLDLLLYTGFKSKINYTNKTTIQANYFEINNSNTNLAQLKNEFKIIYKISETNNFKCQLQTFLPDTKRNVNYNFLNFEITHKFLKQNIETYVKAQNLFNIKKYEDRFISDFGSSFYSYNLQERFLLLGIVCKVF